MPIVAKNESTFTPAPEGQWRAVCCDVVDLGMVKTEWNGVTKNQHKIRVVFQIEEINPENNKPFLIQRRFTLSMHEKAALRQFLESWRGKAYTEDQAKDGIDVELMVGQNAVIQIAHAQRGGSTWADILSIMKPMKGQEPLAVTDYVRVIDRPVDNGKAKAATAVHADDFPEPLDADADDLPF